MSLPLPRELSNGEYVDFFSRHTWASLGDIPAWGKLVRDSGRSILLFPLPHLVAGKIISPTAWLLNALGWTPEAIQTQNYFEDPSRRSVALYDITGREPGHFQQSIKLNKNLVRNGQFYEIDWKKLIGNTAKDTAKDVAGIGVGAIVLGAIALGAFNSISGGRR